MNHPILRKAAISLSILLVFAICAAVFLLRRSAPYALPFQTDEVASVSFYWVNEAKRKDITASADITAITDALCGSATGRAYAHIPDGGQTFYLVFHLQNGSAFICTYFQTEKTAGYFADGTSRVKLSKLDLSSLWDMLPYEEIAAIAEKELSESDLPSLL